MRAFLKSTFVTSKKESERQGENQTYDSPSQNYDILLNILGFPQTRATTLSPAILDHQIASITKKLEELQKVDIETKTDMANKLNQAGMLTVYITAFIAFIAFAAVVATGISAGAPFATIFQAGGAGATFFTANGINLLTAVVVGKVVQEGSRYSIDSTHAKHELKQRYLERDIKRANALKEKLQTREKLLLDADNKVLITELNDALNPLLQTWFTDYFLYPSSPDNRDDIKTPKAKHAKQIKKLYDAAKYINSEKYKDLTDNFAHSTKTKISKVTQETMDILLANHVKLSDPNVTSVFKTSDKYYAQYETGDGIRIKAIDKDSGKIGQEIPAEDIRPEPLGEEELETNLGDTTLSEVAKKIAQEEDLASFKYIASSDDGTKPAIIFKMLPGEAIDDTTSFEESEQVISGMNAALTDVGLGDLMQFLETNPDNIEAYIRDLKGKIAYVGDEEYTVEIEGEAGFSNFVNDLDIEDLDPGAANAALDQIDAVIKHAIGIINSTTTYDVTDENLATMLNQQIRHERSTQTDIPLAPSDFNNAKAATEVASEAMYKNMQSALGTRNDLSKLPGMLPDETLSRAADAGRGR